MVKDNKNKSSSSQKKENSWKTADYGATFTKKDVKALGSQGYNSNKIMKVAQAAYASGKVGKVNKTNQALYDLSSNTMKVGKNTTMRQGQESTSYFLPGRGGSVTGDSRKVFGWNGFGDSMSINRYGGGDSYKQTGVWSLPSAYRSGGGGAATGGNTTGGGTTAGGTGTGAGEVLPVDYIPPPEEPTTEQQMPGMMSGGGVGINSAMGIRRKKSSAKLSGASTRGTSQFNRGLSINSFNV